MLPSEIPKLPPDPPVRRCPDVWKLLMFGNFSSLTTPFLRQVSAPNSFVTLFLFYILSYLLSLFLSFTFFSTSFRRQWVDFLGARCPPPVFRSHFMVFVQHSNDLLMNLWQRKWSPHPIPLPFSNSPLRDGVDPCLLYNGMNLHSYFFRHSIRSNPLNLFATSTV